MSTTNLITGAAGLLGSHIAEQLTSSGQPVRALVRPTTDTSYLESLNVELVQGDLHDVDSIRRAVEGVNNIYHCAAFVGDWGPWSKFYDGTVETTRNLVDACRGAEQARILHVSSISVYGLASSPSGEITEDLPIGTKHWMWDHYGRSKVQAEDEIRKYANHVIVRPSWIYGPRDRGSFPRVIAALREKRFRFLGSGENPLNIIHASDVARGAILAATAPAAKGRAYHLCSRGEITPKQLVDMFCERLELPKVRRHVPPKLAWSVAFASEMAFGLLRRPQPPRITRRALYVIGRPTQFSIARAEEELGWQPEIPIESGLRETLDWYLDWEAAMGEAGAGTAKTA